MKDNLEIKLYKILSDLQKSHRCKQTVMAEAINERLNKSLESYTQELENTVKFLAKKNEAPMLKRLNKEKINVRIN